MRLRVTAYCFCFLVGFSLFAVVSVKAGPYKRGNVAVSGQGDHTGFPCPSVDTSGTPCVSTLLLVDSGDTLFQTALYDAHGNLTNSSFQDLFTVSGITPGSSWEFLFTTVPVGNNFGAVGCGEHDQATDSSNQPRECSETRPGATSFRSSVLPAAAGSRCWWWRNRLPRCR